MACAVGIVAVRLLDQRGAVFEMTKMIVRVAALLMALTAVFSLCQPAGATEAPASDSSTELVASNPWDFIVDAVQAAQQAVQDFRVCFNPPIPPPSPGTAYGYALVCGSAFAGDAISIAGEAERDAANEVLSHTVVCVPYGPVIRCCNVLTGQGCFSAPEPAAPPAP